MRLLLSVDRLAAVCSGSVVFDFPAWRAGSCLIASATVRWLATLTIGGINAIGPRRDASKTSLVRLCGTP